MNYSTRTENYTSKEGHPLYIYGTLIMALLDASLLRRVSFYSMRIMTFLDVFANIFPPQMWKKIDSLTRAPGTPFTS